jgi:hypothetical protein
MGELMNRYYLRNDHAFDNLLEETARDRSRHIRDTEAATTPFHAERLAIARKILTGQRTPIVAAFIRELKDRAVVHPTILSQAYASATAGPDGITRPRAGDIQDSVLRDGALAIWNDAALVAWPTILEDVAAGRDPESVQIPNPASVTVV